MEKLGEIWAIDNSITTDSNKREYTLPAKIVRRPELIEIETNTADADDPDYIKIDDWDVIPGAPGSTGLLVFDHQPTAARKLKIHYGGLHPDLTTYSSQISETVHPNVAVAYFVEAALEWFVGKVAGSKANSFWVARWNEAQRNAAVQLALFPVPKPELQDKFFTLPGNEYDPDEGYYTV